MPSPRCIAATQPLRGKLFAFSSDFLLVFSDYRPWRENSSESWAVS
jgi:hypothetical protein